jgi:PhnB protein
VPKRSLADRLDALINETLLSPSALHTKDRRLAPLAQMAADLRDLPRPGFKENLKNDLQRRAVMNTTTVNPIRQGFHTVTPYITVRQAAELIDFIKSVFGAQELFRTTGPAGGIHAEVQIGDSMMMIGGGPALHDAPVPNAFQYYVPNVDEVYARALAAGAITLQGITENYGDRFTAVRDPFGNSWYISTHLGAAYVPDGLRDVSLYLSPVGAPRLIDFLKKAFNASEFVRYDSPGGVVHHAKIRIGDSMIEMGEAHGPWQSMPAMVYLYVPDADAVYRSALDAGAASLSAPVDQPYGDRVAAVQDAWGNQWYIATHIKDI